MAGGDWDGGSISTWRRARHLVPSDARRDAGAFDREVWVSCSAEHPDALPGDQDGDEAAAEELSPSA